MSPAGGSLAVRSVLHSDLRRRPPPRPPGSGAPSGCRHRVSATSRLPAAALTVHPLPRHSGGLTTGPVTPHLCKTAPCRDCSWGRPEACAGVLQRLGPLGTARPRPLRRAGALGSHSAHTSDLRPQAFKKKAAGSSLPSLSLRRGGPRPSAVPAGSVHGSRAGPPPAERCSVRGTVVKGRGRVPAQLRASGLPH